MAESNTQPIPIILCGKELQVGGKVTPLLKPEVEVIHFVQGLDEAKTNLPSLLAGKGPSPDSTKATPFGTGDYSRAPSAVVFGRGNPPEVVEELHRLLHSSTPNVVWIAGDPAVVPPAQPGPGYAEKTAENVKRTIIRSVGDGVSGQNIVFY